MVHLRRAGFVGNELISLFNVFIRPVIEYCCVVYHPLLTVTQSNAEEKKRGRNTLTISLVKTLTVQGSLGTLGPR